MNEILILGKLKFDLRDPEEAFFAGEELSSILNSEVKPVQTIPALFKKEPFNKLSDEIIHIITRNLYLGEIQGYLTKTKSVNISKLLFCPSFFREIYLIIEDTKETEILEKVFQEKYKKLYQYFSVPIEDQKNLILIRLIPLQTLFEFITDIKKMPEVAITPKNTKSWKDYFSEKEKGIEKGIEELLNHLRINYFKAPHLGLGKRHIGDFVDWASTDLRKPFLHYLHKYKGKGDPRISRALINLLKVEKGELILDPFVGSGAFIADAPTMGINAIGIELLELGTLISEVKCNLNYDITKLKEEIIKLFETINYSETGLFRQDLSNKVNEVQKNLKEHLGDNKDLKNIGPHLPKIIFLLEYINKITYERAKKFLLVLLSQQIVEFAEKSRVNNFIAFFQNYVEDRYLALYGTLKLAEKIEVNLNEGEIKIIKGDSTRINFLKENSIDGILTSPPYFDALDYIGNNKVSLIILGFEEDLKIGSTKDYFSQFEKDTLELPDSSLNLIKLLETSRRSQKAEIVRNYLKMMKLSFKECYRVLKPGKMYVMVVSKYHNWLINGIEQKIDTSKVIVDLGISVGFKLARVITHGLSKADKGKIDLEEILCFQK